jgi:hypothetical protein
VSNEMVSSVLGGKAGFHSAKEAELAYKRFQRNNAIVDQFDDHVSIKAIADNFGLSSAMIRNILTENERDWRTQSVNGTIPRSPIERVGIESVYQDRRSIEQGSKALLIAILKMFAKRRQAPHGMPPADFLRACEEHRIALG